MIIELTLSECYASTLLKGSYDTDNILANEGNNSLNSLKYNYQMNIE